MRISTGMIFDSGVRSMQNLTSTLLHNQQQISSGRRILTPSDDPVAAARALEIDHAKAMNTQYGLSLGNAKDTLAMVDSQLSSAGDLLTRVRELTVQSGNAALSESDRKSISSELRSRFDELIAIGNSTDGTGQYLFSGYQGSTMPFTGSVINGVTYRGDEGQRALRVSSSREIPVSNSGSDIFMRIKNGNGIFSTGTQTLRSANATQPTFEGWNSTGAGPATPVDVSLRFWVNPAATAGFSTGTVTIPTAPAPGITLTAPDNTFNISANSVVPASLITVPSGTTLDDTNAVATLQPLIDAALGAGVATVSLNSSGNLVVSSTATGSTSAITLTSGAGLGLANLIGAVPVSVSGNIAGTTFYDLVNSSGNSLFAGNVSDTTTAAGQAGFVGHVYSSGTPINLSGVPPLSAAFNYNATVVITGAPQTGDSFTFTRSTANLLVKAKTLTSSAARATINKGQLNPLDPMATFKWSSVANSGNLEVRFWVNTVAASGSATGSATFPPGYTVAAGANQFSISVDGAAAATVTVPNGALTSANVVATLTGSPGWPAGATAALNAAGQLVVTSTATGNTSAIALSAVVGNTGLTNLFGAPVSVAGTAAGATSYDLVDAVSGKSLYTGAVSTPGSAGYVGHAYTSGGSIVLSGTNPPYSQVFDYGASVAVSGIPASGDTFTIKNSKDPYGNGTFITAPKTMAAVNTGSGITGVGEVLDAAKWNTATNSGKLEVRFWKDTKVLPQVLYYDLVDKTTEKSLFTNTTSTSSGVANTYTHKFTSGDAINFSGLASAYGDFGAAVTISGTPSTGDVFTLDKSTSESVFDTLGKLINALESPVGTGSNGNTALHNALTSVINNLGQASDNILRVRADIGTRLGEADTLDGVSQDMSLQYSETLSRLQDVDYSKAITDMTRQQTQLDAAQKSFVNVSKLSLFNYV